MINLTESVGSEFRHIVSFEEGGQAIRLEKSCYQVKLGDRQSDWLYNLLLGVRVAPATIAFTQPFYELLYGYFFGREAEDTDRRDSFEPL